MTRFLAIVMASGTAIACAFAAVRVAPELVAGAPHLQTGAALVAIVGMCEGVVLALLVCPDTSRSSS